MSFPYQGGCHCGNIRFEIELANPIDETEIIDCNCSICTMKGFLHVIISQKRLKLTKGTIEDDMTTYTFNTKVAQWYHCKTCGCSPFYVPRSNPDGYDVNLRCLDCYAAKKEAFKIVPFDGQNHEKNAAALAHLSKD